MPIAAGWTANSAAKSFTLGRDRCLCCAGSSSSETPDARWLAALVPFAVTVQFALIGLGVIKDEASVKAMSRTGDPREILRGPLFYGIMFVVLTIVFWRDSPTGIVALMMLCGGDGIADIIGRKVKSPKLSWSENKSIAGSLGVFFGGWILSALILFIYVNAGVFPAPFTLYLMPLTLIALGTTIIESLPFKDVDNITATSCLCCDGLFFVLMVRLCRTGHVFLNRKTSEILKISES